MRAVKRRTGSPSLAFGQHEARVFRNLPSLDSRIERIARQGQHRFVVAAMPAGLYARD